MGIMDFVKVGEGKKRFIIKTWQLFRSIFGRHPQRYLPLSPQSVPQSKAMKRKKKNQAAPEGCFSVYIGSEKRRFVIKTDCANHPLFQKLLEDAELEYGYASEGPILIPCEVDLFCKVLAEVNTEKFLSG